jgi:hypothetical protein
MKCNEHHNELSTEIFGTTDFIEQNLSLQADRSSTSQDFPRIVRNAKTHCRLQKGATSVRILSQINPVHDRSSYFLKIYFNIILPSTHIYLPKVFFLLGLLTKILYAFFSPLCLLQTPQISQQILDWLSNFHSLKNRTT